MWYFKNDKEVVLFVSLNVFVALLNLATLILAAYNVFRYLCARKIKRILII